MDAATQPTKGRSRGAGDRDPTPAAAAPLPEMAPTPRRRSLDLARLLASRDFAFNSRRYLISLLAAGLVMGIALLLSGIKSGLENEITRTIGSVWLTRT